MKEINSEDLSIIEFLKEARILKRQLNLMKNNMDKINIDNLLNLLAICKTMENEFKELKIASKGALTKDGWEIR